MTAQQQAGGPQGAQSTPSGPPYAPQTKGLGGIPSQIPDAPLSTIFLFLFLIGALTHVSIFKANRARGKLFVMSMMTFGFCMCRLVTMALRLAWAAHQRNVRLAIAANIFVQAGTLLLYIINLIFTQRIIRAQHPRLGWHKGLSIVARLTVVIVVLTLIILIFAVVQQQYTLNTRIREIDHALQLYGSTCFLVVAILPVPMIIIGLIIPRRIRTEKFGSGRFREKILILVACTSLCALRAGFSCGIAWSPTTPRSATHTPWYLSKAAFYCFCFIPELLVVYLYAIVRVDRRFFVPGGARGSYMPEDKGLGRKQSILRSFKVNNVKVMTRFPYVNAGFANPDTVRFYTEEELFEDGFSLRTMRNSSGTLAAATLDQDSRTGVWYLQRHSLSPSYADSTAGFLAHAGSVPMVGNSTRASSQTFDIERAWSLPSSNHGRPSLNSRWSDRTMNQMTVLPPAVLSPARRYSEEDVSPV